MKKDLDCRQVCTESRYIITLFVRKVIRSDMSLKDGGTMAFISQFIDEVDDNVKHTCSEIFGIKGKKMRAQL